jgi:hypothetical protein
VDQGCEDPLRHAPVDRQARGLAQAPAGAAQELTDAEKATSNVVTLGDAAEAPAEWLGPTPHFVMVGDFKDYSFAINAKDPASLESRALVEYTWGKIWNAKAYNACSGMPRFGHSGILTEAQTRDLVALLVDPASPVNK